MPLVGFEPTMPVFERAKTVHDRAATAIGSYSTSCTQYCSRINSEGGTSECLIYDRRTSGMNNDCALVVVVVVAQKILNLYCHIYSM
jgi:hypothetical protein